LERAIGIEAIQKLKKVRIGIIGSGPLCNDLIVCLQGLGISDIMIMDNSRVETTQDPYEFLIVLSNGNKRDSKVKCLQSITNIINNEIGVYGIHLKPTSEELLDAFENPDLIIDTTNNSKSKRIALKYCVKKKMVFLSMSSTENFAAYEIYNPGDKTNERLILNKFDGKQQGALTSGVIVPIAIEEIRKILVPIQSDSKRVEKSLFYNTISNEQLQEVKTINDEKRHTLLGKHAILAGWGGVNTTSSLKLVQMNCDITCVDFDKVENVNLTRQYLSYNEVGSLKAEVAERRLRKINPKIKVFGEPDTINENSDKYFWDKKYDIIVLGVDNNQSRYAINEFAYKYQKPAINTGLEVCPIEGSSAELQSFEPDTTQCLNCQKGFTDGEFIKDSRQSCAMMPDPNVIMPNMLIGSLAAVEARNILLGISSLGGSSIYYSSNSQPRIKNIKNRGDICKHD